MIPHNNRNKWETSTKHLSDHVSKRMLSIDIVIGRCAARRLGTPLLPRVWDKQASLGHSTATSIS